MINHAKNRRPNSSRPTKSRSKMGKTNANSTMACALLRLVRPVLIKDNIVFIRIPYYTQLFRNPGGDVVGDLLENCRKRITGGGKEILSVINVWSARFLGNIDQQVFSRGNAIIGCSS